MSALPLDVERLALLGWRLFPSTRKRKGMFKGYVDRATHDLDTLGGWAREYPGCNWGVIPGGSGVWALDVDCPSPDHAADGVAALRDLCALHGALPSRPHGRSGGGGHLLVFRDAGHPIRSATGTPAPGIDPRAGRVSFTVAPSIHRNGKSYRWVVAPWEMEAPVAPEWLLEALKPPPAPALPARAFAPTSDRAVRAIMKSAHMVCDAAPGTRNGTLHRRAVFVGGFVGAGALGRAEAERELIAIGMAAGQSRAEATSTVRSGLAAGERRPLEWRAA